MSTEHEDLTPGQQRELDSFEAAYDGRPVDAEFSELADLAAALKGSRPRIGENFASRLDRRVDDHFPAGWLASGRDRRSRTDRLKARFAGRRRRLLLPATAGLAGVLVVGTVIASGLPGNDNGKQRSDTAASVTAKSTSSSDATDAPAGATAKSAAGPAGVANGSRNRRVARSTRITLGTEPEDVQKVSNAVASVVDAHNGIVLNSNVEDGPDGVAGANFRIRVPAGQAESAVAELSNLADLRSRSQGTTDITAPTLSVKAKLKTARARAESLVNQLAATTTDAARAKVEAELAKQRRRVARLVSQSARLERRVRFTTIMVNVQTGKGFDYGSNGSWGPGNALDDIGNNLGTAAGVALIMLAIALPLAFLALLIALINRAWVGASRRRAIKGD